MYKELEEKLPSWLRPALKSIRPWANKLLKRFPSTALLYSSLRDPVNEGHRAEIALTLLKWHFFHRPLNRPLICRIDDRFCTTVFPDSDSGVLNLYTRGVDSESTTFVRSYLSKGDFFIDVGCNVGNRAVVLTDLAEGGALIDPNPLCIRRAKENFRLNNIQLENYLFIEAAGAAKPGEVGFVNLGGTNTCSRVQATHDEKAALVPTVTIDEVAKQIGKSPTYLKIDAEGYDFEVLQGAVDTIKEGTLRLIKFERLPTLEVNMFTSFFAGLGWEVFALDGQGRATQEQWHIENSLDLFARPEPQ